MKVIILAGGKGSRLLPFTTNFPKPLMPVGERPILEILMQRLKAEGLTDIIIATGHMEELIRAYFGDGQKVGVHIQYSREDTPMGTAGPLDLVRAQLTDTFLLMNGDVLSDLQFKDMIRHHQERDAMATVALSRRNVFIDFGVVETNASSAITAWKEKPVIDYLVSTGIYCISAKAMDYLPCGEFTNLPDLLLKLKAAGHLVSGYVHEGYWLDIGRREDYEKACEDIEKFK